MGKISKRKHFLAESHVAVFYLGEEEKERKTAGVGQGLPAHTPLGTEALCRRDLRAAFFAEENGNTLILFFFFS